MENKNEVSILWDNFISLLHKNLEKTEIEAWVDQIKLIQFSPEKILVGGLNQFFCNWIRDQHRELIRNLLYECFSTLNLEKDFQLIFKVHSIKKSNQNEFLKQDKNIYDDCLDPKHRFEFFINGSNTNIAYATALAVAENLDSTQYNPLFLCGDVGLGKTHLLQAIGIYIREKYPHKKILYTSSEQFTNEIISGIRFGKINQARQKYRSLELLLIDDIHFLENKESTQEEFFHTFNELINNQKQIVLTADRYPREIKNLEERLISRFSSGMVARIEPPDLETRIAIINSEVERLDIPMPEEVIRHIARNVKSNVRDMKGIIIRLEAEWSLMKQEINVESTSRILKEVLNLDNSPKNIEHIIKRVSKKFDIKVSDIKSEKRDREISTARQTAMYIVRELTGLSYPVIGKHFGGKNHTSVLQACKKTNTSIEEDPEFKQIVSSLTRELSL